MDGITDKELIATFVINIMNNLCPVLTCNEVLRDLLASYEAV